MKAIVGGSLIRDGKILLLKRTKTRQFWPGLWEVPGGKVEKNETKEEAIRREFFEETGMKIKVIERCNEFSYIYVDEEAAETDFLVNSNGRGVRIDPQEHTEYGWFTMKDLEKLEIDVQMKDSILKAFGKRENE